MLQRFLMLIMTAHIIIFISPVFGAAAKKTTPEKRIDEKRAFSAHSYTSLNPADGSLINNARPTISAEYVDEGIGINQTNIKLFVDGVDVSSQIQASQNKVTYMPAQPLSDGLHKVKLDIDDKAGNPSTVTWTFTLHTQPPKIKITSHTQNQYVNKSPVLVTGSVDDARVRVVVNGIAAIVEKGVFSAKVNLIEGSNTVTAVAADPFGNTGTDSVALTLDSKPPTVEITSPSPNSLLNTRTVTVSGIVDKKAAAVTVVSAQTGTQPSAAETSNGAFTAKDVALAEGVNTITVRAVSSAGNVGTTSIRVTVDTVPPRIAILSPKDHTMTNKKMITVSGTVDDPTAIVRVNNTPVQVSKGAFTVSGVNLAEGNNTITATAVDRAGNQAQAASIIVMLKTMPPAPPKLGELPFVTRENVIMVTGTAEPGSQIELFMNSASKGTVKTDEKGSFAFKVSLAEGNNAFSAIATDAVGNVSASSAVVNVYLDTKPPRIL